MSILWARKPALLITAPDELRSDSFGTHIGAAAQPAAHHTGAKD